MDYYLYWDAASKLLVPLEYDGNSVMKASAANWSPFYNESKTTLPLLNRLLANPAIRQRYLAHIRTMMKTTMDQTTADALIDKYAALIDSNVNADPKKATTYAQFPTECTVLKNFIKNHRTFINSNVEVNVQGVDIQSLVLDAIPSDIEQAKVTTKVAVTNKVGKAWLYYSSGFVGVFQKIEMFDDGAHNDGAAGDGVFGAVIPAFAKGTYVRYYTEIIANDAKKTATYFPEGAEHDVFIYQVKQTTIATDVVINELMTSNKTTASDQDGEFDDWIELYNTSTTEKDLSGWFLSDDATKLKKFVFPVGTKIPAKGYLIVWADENGKQAGLHANFKFSASGEACYLVTPDERVAQEVVFAAQETDKGYARYPNGTGNFKIQKATFNGNNDSAVGVKDANPELTFDVFPNPNNGSFKVISKDNNMTNVLIFNASGQLLHQQNFYQQTEINLGDIPRGIYFVKVGAVVKRVILQ
jgi:hypothetical protein